jgi:hypothetical protein
MAQRPEAACLRGSIAEAVQDVDVAAFKVETGTKVIEAIVAERMSGSDAEQEDIAHRDSAVFEERGEI